MTATKTSTVTAPTFQSPIAGLLGVVFVTLKLCGVIAWPWLWVTAPFWIPLVIYLGLLAVILVIAIIAGIIALIWD